MTSSGESVFVSAVADGRPQHVRAAMVGLLVMTACLPVIVAQMQINTQVQMGPRGGGSMRYSNIYMQTKALPSESRNYAMSSGMMRSEHRYARSVSGQLPSAGRMAHLTPSLTYSRTQQPQWARRPNYGSLRHPSKTSYGQSLPWRQKSPGVSSYNIHTPSSKMLGSRAGRSQLRSPTYLQRRPSTLGSSGYGTLSYRR